MTWRYKIDKKKHCEGFVVVNVGVWCNIDDCVNCKRGTGVPTGTPFDEQWWEALHVARNAAKPDKDLKKDLMSIDRTCGYKYMSVLAAFYCKGGVGGTGDLDLDKGWKDPFHGSRATCQFNSGLPATNDRPSFWAPPTTGEKTAHSVIFIDWCCCAGRTNYMDAYGTPPKQP